MKGAYEHEKDHKHPVDPLGVPDFRSCAAFEENEIIHRHRFTQRMIARAIGSNGHALFYGRNNGRETVSVKISRKDQKGLRFTGDVRASSVVKAFPLRNASDTCTILHHKKDQKVFATAMRQTREPPDSYSFTSGGGIPCFTPGRNIS